MGSPVPVTLFSRYLGTRQGRITPVNYAPVSGSYVYVLGDDLPGNIGQLGQNDYVEAKRNVTCDGVSFIRGTFYFRPQTLAMPGGTSWEAAVFVDGVEQVKVPFTTKKRQRFDLAANVSKLTGSHEVIFRLRLVGGSPATPYVVELPGLYLDALAQDETGFSPVLINRDPEPNETAVPVSTNITVDIVDIHSFGISLPDTKVYVNGVLAFDAGVFQTGFTGASSAHSAPRSDTRRVVIDPNVNFVSQQVVTVRVVSLAGALPIDQTYTFTCEDVTAPTLGIQAQAVELSRVRLTFNEAMRQLSATDLNDALRAANYTITRDPDMDPRVPSVTVTVVGVESKSPTQVDLLTNIPLTPGGMYIVTATNVADVAGNVIAGPNNVAKFTGWVPPKPLGRQFDLYRFMPEFLRVKDASHDYHLMKFLGCLQEQNDLLLWDIDSFSSIRDPDTAAEKFVDAMLTELGNPFPFDIGLTDKRKLVRTLVPIYKQKGTEPGIINAIRLFTGVEVTLKQYNLIAWVLGVSLLGSLVEGEGTLLNIGSGSGLYSFEVISPVSLTSEQLTRIAKIVKLLKPEHTHHVRTVTP
jgi:phage tail-like protein